MKFVAWTMVDDRELMEKWVWRPLRIVLGADCARLGKYAIL